MTDTLITSHEVDAAPGVGRVARVIGPVVDVEFPADQMPNIANALLIDIDAGELSRTITAEVALHVGDNIVRAISLKPTDGMRRGATVRDTGGPISVISWVISAWRAWLASRVRDSISWFALSVADFMARCWLARIDADDCSR